jgi:hypothetical protein
VLSCYAISVVDECLLRQGTYEAEMRLLAERLCGELDATRKALRLLPPQRV